MNLLIWGLILDILGVLVLTLTAIIDYPHQRIFAEKEWWKRYYWTGWRPIFKVMPPNEKSKWIIRWKNRAIKYGFIPPRYLWNIIGFLIVLSGFILQLSFYLSG